MADVILPKTGMYEGSVTLIEWLAAEGEEIDEGDPIFVMETDKVEMEIEAMCAGWLHQQAEPGFEAPIGTRIGVIAATVAEYEAVAGPG